MIYFPDDDDDDDGDGDIIGPLPPSSDQPSTLGAAEEFEMRAKRMKDKLLNKVRTEAQGRNTPESLLAQLTKSSAELMVLLICLSSMSAHPFVNFHCKSLLLL